MKLLEGGMQKIRYILESFSSNNRDILVYRKKD